PHREAPVAPMCRSIVRTRGVEGARRLLYRIEAVVAPRRLWRHTVLQCFEGGLHDCVLHVCGTHLDAVAPRVFDKAARRVEPHRLRTQQTGEKRCRIVQLEPRARVDEQRETDGVALGEAEVRERLDLRVDTGCGVVIDTAVAHALEKL